LLSGCALQSHNKKLPKWGWEQLEVTCNPKVSDLTYSTWNFEDNHFPRLPNSSFEFYKPSFLEKFIESHLVMLQGNSGLKPKEGEVTSRPWHWPINFRGQVFSGGDYYIYLLGNPIVFWGVIAGIVAFLVSLGRWRKFIWYSQVEGHSNINKIMRI
jgi:dolichyl-phosphate-mannose-protein mannosyltransferase